uniref:Peptidase S1 domain-containing protein n=1 Tax=Panagrolaimus sp. ES5 TaxID=591445 RepID=A0AC34F1Y3_9BILA
MKFVAILLLLFTFSLFCSGYNPNRIWNGTSVEYSNVPRILGLSISEYAVPINETQERRMGYPKMGVGLCSASVISKRHILTAGHCVGDWTYNRLSHELVPREGIIIDFDKLDTNFGNKSINGTNLFLNGHGLTTLHHSHEKWTNISDVHQHDVAVLEFPKDVDLQIEPVLLGKNYVVGDNDFGISVGYGDANLENKALEETAMEITVPILKDCLGTKQNEDIICSGTKTTRVDHGDSGGPLFFEKNNKRYQVGIAHALEYINRTGAHPSADFGTFMRVSSYCEWIEKTTNNEAKCVEIEGYPKADAQTGAAISYNIFFSLLSFILAFFIIAF